MADKEKETEEVVLGPMVMKAGFDFKKAIAKAKKHAVNYGIFDDWYKKHPEDRKEEKK